MPNPDPQKSEALSQRPLFKTDILQSGKNFWLPDTTLAGNCPYETEFRQGEELSSSSVPGYPTPPGDSVGPHHNPDIHVHAKSISHWMLSTYCFVLAHRINLYNKYLKEMQSLPPTQTPDSPGRYLRACRLLTEQILRPQLPPIPNFSWGTNDPVLPIFEMIHQPKFDQNNPSNKIVSYKVFGVVEVRQHHLGSGVIHPREPEWSSSSSSPSSSSIGNIIVDN
jgi:hypothetical protein